MIEKNDNCLDYASLHQGTKLSEQTCLLNEELVARYRAAVQDNSEAIRDPDGSNLVPPMAVAAISLQDAITELKIPDGTLHVGHEIDVMQPVKLGETITCRSNVSSNNVRGNWRFLGIEHISTNFLGTPVMTSKSTIMLPSVDKPNEK